MQIQNESMPQIILGWNKRLCALTEKYHSLRVIYFQNENCELDNCKQSEVSFKKS